MLSGANWWTVRRELPTHEELPPPAKTRLPEPQAEARQEVQLLRPAEFRAGSTVPAAKLPPAALLGVVPKPLPLMERARPALPRSLQYRFRDLLPPQVRRRTRGWSPGPGRNPRPHSLQVRGGWPTGLTESTLLLCLMARGLVRTLRPVAPSPMSPSPRSKCSGIDATRAAPQLWLALPLSFLGVISVLTC